MPAKTATPAKQQKLKRNERERKRVHQVNQGFNRLRDKVPKISQNKKLSKVETLKEAAKYIEYLRNILQTDASNNFHMQCSGQPFMQPSFPSHKYSPDISPGDSSYYSDSFEEQKYMSY